MTPINRPGKRGPHPAQAIGNKGFKRDTPTGLSDQAVTGSPINRGIIATLFSVPFHQRNAKQSARVNTMVDSALVQRANIKKRRRKIRKSK